MTAALIDPDDPRHPPQDVIEAANRVGRWFAERNAPGWQLGPCADRGVYTTAAAREGLCDSHFGIYSHLLRMAQERGFRSVSEALRALPAPAL